MSDVPSTELLQILELKDEVKRLRAKVAELRTDALAAEMARNSLEKLCDKLENERAEARDATADALSRAVMAESRVRELEMGSEPVAYLFKDALNFNGECMTVQIFSPRCDIGTQIPLYTTPQPVKVPEPKGYEDAPDTTLHTDTDEAWADGWNACREAMLAAQEGGIDE